MSRITKTIAESVAKQLTEKKLSEINELTEKLKAICYNIQSSKIPKEILDFYGKHPDYFNNKKNAYFVGAGLNRYHQVYFTQSLPLKSDTTQIEAKEAQQVIKIEDKIETKRKERKELLIQIELALINLRTYKNVENEFPEAFKLLPPTQVNTQLSVNVKSIRCKLDKSTC